LSVTEVMRPGAPKRLVIRKRNCHGRPPLQTVVFG
jgi:hypothetical protein